MKKKIIALNGSARKHGNTAQMLDAFLEGVGSAGDFEIERIDLFDLDYKGCRGCHGCELKSRTGIGCVQKDGASELLARMRQADGIVFASPIFFWELTAQLRGLLERYIYPGALDHHQEIEAIYTMYQPEEVSRRSFTPHADTVRGMMTDFLWDVEFSELIINQTQSWETGKWDIYTNITPAHSAMVEAVHEKRWPQDLQHGKEAGAEFAVRVLE